MGRHYSYRPGSYYVTDDRTGFPQYAGRTRKQWNNLIVDESVWEPRQPQDLVKGVKDNQTVPDARPGSPPVFVGPLYTTTSSNIPPQGSAVELPSLYSFQIGDNIGIVQDDGSIWLAVLNGIDVAGGMISFTPPTLLNASSGNDLINYRTMGSAAPIPPTPPIGAPGALDFSDADNSDFIPSL